MKKKFSLKDHLFNREKVAYLGSLFSKADKNFKKDEFVEAVMKKLTKLELKERIKKSKIKWFYFHYENGGAY